MPDEPTVGHGALKSSAIFGWAPTSPEERSVDEFDQKSTIHIRFERVSDLDEFAGGLLGIGEGAVSGEFHGPAVIWGTWITVSSSRWLSNRSPHGQRIMLFGFCDGIFSPRSHIAYLRAVESLDRATPGSRPLSASAGTPATRLETLSGLGEGRRRAAHVFARLRSRIEAAAPLPSRFSVRVADAARYRSDVDFAEIDQPAVGAARVSAAGEGGHTPLKGTGNPKANLLLVGPRNRRRPLSVGGVLKEAAH